MRSAPILTDSVTLVAVTSHPSRDTGHYFSGN